MGGDMQGRLARGDKEIERAQKMGIKDMRRSSKWRNGPGARIFAATG